jgi:hypothetical protein
MLRPLALLIAAAGSVAAAPMTYTLTGTGSGTWNTQAFSNAAFTFTFTSDTSTVTHNGNIDSTPGGTSATVNVAGFSPAQLTGDQAIFMDHAGETAGIWHFDGAQYLTVTNQVFTSDDLTTSIPPDSVTGTAWSYATPISLSTGGTLYFTSVQNVFYSQQTGNGSAGQPLLVSVNPQNGSQTVNTTQTYTVIVGSIAGASDVGGVDVQFRDKPTYGNACWLFFNPTANTLAINFQGNWGSPTPIGASGSTLTGDACTVDTTGVTASTASDYLTLAIPVRITVGDNNTWPIFVDTQTKENVDAGYQQLGSVTAKSGPAPSFTLSIGPAYQAAATGAAATYTVTVTPANGFNEPITFNATSTPVQSGNTTALSFSFNPATVQGSGSTTMTVTSPSSATPGGYNIAVTGVSQTYANSAGATLQLDNAPPALTLTPTSGTGSSQTFTITWADSTDVGTINLLIAPSLSGQNACWIYFDVKGEGPDHLPAHLFMASDDGTSWIDGGAANFDGFSGSNGSASNSQCTVGPGISYNNDAGFVTGLHSGFSGVSIPVTFKPAFAGTKTLYVNGADAAGFVTGYQPMGGWTVQ